MNFVQTLEETLRDLASEARKRHPGVKEASERATLRLRTLQNQYVSEVRRANSATPGSVPHPTTRLFANSELLHPFLLAANYPNASAELLEIAVRAMRLLMEADAIHPNDAIQMLRVWMIQAQAVVAYYQIQYAKEILQESDAHATSTHSVPGPGLAASISSSSQSTGSSWFSWASTSSQTTSNNLNDHRHGVLQSTKSAATASQQSPAQMDHRAKQILSCLLQLLENLKQYPQYLTLELWSNATALSCIWLHYTPLKHTVHQAARSTLKQVMNRLFATRNSDSKVRPYTWEDLLQLCDDAKLQWHGAFQLCQRNVGPTVMVHPPATELALEILTHTMREQDLDFMTDKLVQRSMGICVKLLQDKRASLGKFLRTMQWTAALCQQYGSSHPSECRELFALALRPVITATEACQKQDDFEDGFVYEQGFEIELLEGGPKKARSTTLIPALTLWKAAVALEAMHHILNREETADLWFLLEDAPTLCVLAETLSDFATICASCTDHILQLVRFADALPYTGTEVFAKTSIKVKPTFFRKVEQACNNDTCQALLMETTLSKATEKVSSFSSEKGILGEALWIALQNLLRVSECMNGIENSKTILEVTFAPTLAVLQHYLKRCIGSSDLVQLVLNGYANLADVCLPTSALHRKTLLLSLCKLSLPTWGKLDLTAQLQDQHIMTLLSLCRIIHSHFDNIGEDWDIVLRTLDELSIMSISSERLSENAYQSALALSILFSRLAPLTTCFSSQSLLKMASALTKICLTRLERLDLVGSGGDTVIVPRTANPESLGRQNSGDDTDSSISSRIITIGARAIYGAGAEAEKASSALIKGKIAIKFYEDYRQDFVHRLSTSTSRIRVNSIGDVPFVLAALTDTIMANGFRSKECGDQLSDLISSLETASPAIRPFSMDLLSVLAMSHLSSDRILPTPFIGPGCLVFSDPMQSQLWAVEACPDQKVANDAGSDSQGGDKKTQSELLSPLCLKIRTASRPDIAESSLGTLNSILEGVGHNMTGDVWCLVIEAVGSLSGDPMYETVDRTEAAWSNLSSMAFRCLKFIIDDFRDKLTHYQSTCGTMVSLLDCCTSFGRSKHDVNTSLTAITLLWTIADQDTGSDAIDQALSRLVRLASDSRAEVRNASVNTLFSCMVGRGTSFTAEQWKVCFSESIFGVYELVHGRPSEDHASNINSSQPNATRYRVSLHHSRDSQEKQWFETQTLVLRGLSRLLRNYFSQLISTMEQIQPGDLSPTDDVPWFLGVWSKTLHYSLEAADQHGGRDSVSVRTAGVELMILCCQLASESGIEAATVPIRVGTNMEVINGALRTVREAQPSTSSTHHFERQAAHAHRKQLYEEAFNALERFKEGVTNIIKQGGPADETMAQVVHSFVVGLNSLYHCSKSSELRPQDIQLVKGSSSLSDPLLSDHGTDRLESRFVDMITAMLAASGGYSTSRFLNQGQKASITLLRNMASVGSSAAFEALIVLSDMALFYENEEILNRVTKLTHLHSEAARAVSIDVGKDSVSNTCKAYVLLKVQQVFLRNTGKDGVYEGQDYSKLCIILTAGFSGIKQMAREGLDETTLEDEVWMILLETLPVLLSSERLANSTLVIENKTHLSKIVQTAKNNVPPQNVAKLCEILSTTALNAWSIAKKLDVEIEEDSRNEHRRNHRDMLAKLLEDCYSCCCRLKPGDATLMALTKDALMQTIKSTFSTNINTKFDEDVGLAMMRCLRSSSCEPLVISVFAQLSRLATAQNEAIRETVADIFNKVNVAVILESAINQRDESELRAQTAEERVKELTARVKQLQQRNSELMQEVAILQASTAM